MNADKTTQPSPGRKLAGAAAIALAVSIVGCRIYDAQIAANERHEEQQKQQQEHQPQWQGPLPDPNAPQPVPPSMLSSSKVLVIDEGFLSSSKSGVVVDTLPSSKGIVLEDPPEFLPSSKSRVSTPVKSKKSDKKD